MFTTPGELISTSSGNGECSAFHVSTILSTMVVQGGGGWEERGALVLQVFHGLAMMDTPFSWKTLDFYINTVHELVSDLYQRMIGWWSEAHKSGMPAVAEPMIVLSFELRKTRRFVIRAVVFGSRMCGPRNQRVLQHSPAFDSVQYISRVDCSGIAGMWCTLPNTSGPTNSQ